MSYSKHNLYFLLILLAASFVLVYFVIKPFLSPLILAAVFAFLFQPIFVNISNTLGGKRSISALITTCIAFFLIIIPMVFMGYLLFQETRQLYESLANSDTNTITGMLKQAADKINLSALVPKDVNVDFGKYIQQGLEAVVRNLGKIFQSLARLILQMFVFITAFYYLLKDGNGLKNFFVRTSPLQDSEDELIVSRLKAAVSSVFRGSLLVGLIQGVLTGIGLFIFGVPNAVFLGGAAAIASLIPGIGTSLIIFPAVLFLFFTNNTTGAIGLAIWGITAVGLIDNFLGPKLIGSKMKLHPLATFLAVLGGIVFFGPLGFLLGPLAMSVCLTLIEIYQTINYREDGKRTL